MHMLRHEFVNNSTCSHTVEEHIEGCGMSSDKCLRQTSSKDMWHVRLCSGLPAMPCQIKKTQAAASHRAQYNNARELQEGSFCCSWHACNIQETGKKKKKSQHCMYSGSQTRARILHCNCKPDDLPSLKSHPISVNY